MKEMGRYLVTSKRAYRGHEPGAVFDATLDPDAEGRALARGSIQLLERIPADLTPGRYRLPAGWPRGRREHG